ncbi:phosphatase PAP2 family protein [Stieleria magnilauensis]|uniref:phosphatase PAP2 family protein n=1 Tax=Stieleria magnilauensis TaxID=2527963 RepID=UPI003AF41F61
MNGRSAVFAATFLVGLSRVYLGAHYPTDVLAGWTAGIVWSLLVWIIANRISSRRVSVEDHADSAP